MTNSQSLAKSNRSVSHLDFRLLLLYFIALSPSMGTAVSALGRLLLYMLALCIFLFYRATIKPGGVQNLRYLTILILITVGYMLTTVAWSSVPLPESLHAWTRHARLITIPVIYMLIRNFLEGKAILRVFSFGQIFVVLSAWALVCGIPVPWATANAAKDTYAVFGSYLEQSISQSVLVAILWFERDWLFGKNGKQIAIFGAITTLILTLGFLQGRSGHVVALTIIGLAVIYELPQRKKWVAVVIIAGVLGLTTAGSKNFRERMLSVNSEVTSYSEKTVADTSSGLRLYYWHVSLLAAIEKPIFGHGAGSWNHEYRRLGASNANSTTLSISDPHQLFLLWAVEGGLVGMCLLSAIFFYMLLQSKYLAMHSAPTLQAVILALLVAGLFNSMIFGIGMGDYFCIAIGILLSVNKNNTSADMEIYNGG
jgi:O-antigen ligase